MPIHIHPGQNVVGRLPAVLRRRLGAGRWDLTLASIMILMMALLVHGGSQMVHPYQLGQPSALSLDPANLPDYLLDSALRMGTALRFSLLFTLVYAYLAAKSPALERILIPLLDILQSVPILGYLSLSLPAFMSLYPGSTFGLECAAIFAIFTSQAWNMTFSLYSSLKTVPRELTDVARVFQFNAWQRFWRLELPWAMPGLVWNMMMSVSGGWFFVVASESISVADQKIMLPGIGSYIAMAINAGDIGAVGWAILAVLAGVLVYDQLMFRPLVAWAEKFRVEAGPGERPPSSWLLGLIRKARLIRRITAILTMILRRIADLPLALLPRFSASGGWDREPTGSWTLALPTVLLAVSAGGTAYLFRSIAMAEIARAFELGLVTLARVVCSVLLSTLIWVPVGYWVGRRRGLAVNLQWLSQFLAAFPADLLFPLVVAAIVRFELDADLWTTPLMVLSAQWYVLFNVLAGVLAIPRELMDVSANFGVKGWLKWRRVILPSIFPQLVTGMLTAAGACWNVAIVSEWVSWGGRRLEITGLGAYISAATEQGDYSRLALGILVMCLFVILFNHVFWRRLYDLATSRFNPY